VIGLARLAFRLGRFELLAATMLLGVLAGGQLLLRAQLDGIAVPDDCWALWFSGGGGERCDRTITAWFEIENRAGVVLGLMGVAPFAAGVVLGVPLIGRELELGTAPMAWSVAPSRRRWLVARLAPFVLYALIAGGLVAVAAEILWLGREPALPRLRWSDASLHGPPVVARGLAALAVAALAGVVIGRTLPAAILASGIAVALVAGQSIVMQTWLDAEASRHVVRLEPGIDADALFHGGTNVSRGYLGPDGAFLDQIAATVFAPAGTSDPYLWVDQNLPHAVRGVPADRYPAWMLVETLGYSLVAVTAIGATFPVVARRRPH
jgi:hypothetical protein